MASPKKNILEQTCAELIIQDLPSLVCYLKQNFCDPDLKGLTLQQHRVLATLIDIPRSTTELADELGVSLPAISRMIQHLVDSGWVKKETSREDKRQVVLSLTKQGVQTIRQSREHSVQKLVPKLTELSNDQKQTVIKAFEILNTLASKHE